MWEPYTHTVYTHLLHCLLWLLTWKLFSKPRAKNDFPGQNRAFIARGSLCVLSLRSQQIVLLKLIWCQRQLWDSNMEVVSFLIGAQTHTAGQACWDCSYPTKSAIICIQMICRPINHVGQALNKLQLCKMITALFGGFQHLGRIGVNLAWLSELEHRKEPSTGYETFWK